MSPITRMNRRAMLRRGIGVAAFAASMRPLVAANRDEKFAPNPGEESAEERASIDRAAAALARGSTVSEVLMDGTFLPVHPFARFRALIRDHAPSNAVTLVAASEPGDLLEVRGAIQDANGHPIPDALIYAYHTSAKGWYSDRAAHFESDGSKGAGDDFHARLFAYVRSDKDGRYFLRTIRPAGYAGRNLPAHIHVFIEAPTGPRRTLVTEIRFDDDPNLTPEERAKSVAEGFAIRPVTRDASDVGQVEADFRLR